MYDKFKPPFSTYRLLTIWLLAFAVGWSTVALAAGANSASAAMISAAGNGDYGRVQALLSKGVNVNAKDAGGWTALISAVRGGHREVAELLLSKGANVNAKNRGGYTALMFGRDKRGIAELLTRAGARE